MTTTDGGRLAARTFAELSAKLQARVSELAEPAPRPKFDASARPILQAALGLSRQLREAEGEMVRRKDVDDFAILMLSSLRNRVDYEGEDRSRTLLYSVLVATELLELPLKAPARKQLEESIYLDTECLYGNLGPSWKSMDPTACWFIPGAVADPDASLVIDLFKVTTLRYSNFDSTHAEILVPCSKLAAWVHAGKKRKDFDKSWLKAGLFPARETAGQIEKRRDASIRAVQKDLSSKQSSEQKKLDERLAELDRRFEELDEQFSKQDKQLANLGPVADRLKRALAELPALAVMPEAPQRPEILDEVLEAMPPEELRAADEILAADELLDDDLLDDGLLDDESMEDGSGVDLAGDDLLDDDLLGDDDLLDDDLSDDELLDDELLDDLEEQQPILISDELSDAEQGELDLLLRDERQKSEEELSAFAKTFKSRMVGASDRAKMQAMFRQELADRRAQGNERVEETRAAWREARQERRVAEARRQQAEARKDSGAQREKLREARQQRREARKEERARQQRLREERKKELAARKKQLEAEHTKKHEEQRGQRIEQQRQRRDRLRKEYEEKRKAIEARRAKIEKVRDAYEAAIEVYETQCAAVRKQRKEVEAERAKLETRFKSVEEERAEVRADRAEVETQRHKVEKHYDEMKKRCASVLADLDKKAEQELDQIRREARDKIAALDDDQFDSIKARPQDEADQHPAVVLATKGGYQPGKAPTKTAMKALYDKKYGAYLRGLSGKDRQALMREKRRLSMREFDELMEKLVS